LNKAYRKILQHWKFKVNQAVIEILNMISVVAHQTKKRKSVLAFSKFIYLTSM